MKDLTLNYRQSQGKLMRYANFKNGVFVNLVKLDKPYKTGISFAVIETTKNPFCSNGLFKTELEAIEKFNLMVRNAKTENELIFTDIISTTI